MLFPVYSGVGSFRSHKYHAYKSCCRTYGFSFLSQKTAKSNYFQMSLRRQHFLLSYLKTLSAGPVGVWTRNFPLRKTGALLTALTRRRNCYLIMKSWLILWELWKNILGKNPPPISLFATTLPSLNSPYSGRLNRPNSVRWKAISWTRYVQNKRANKKAPKNVSAIFFLSKNAQNFPTCNLMVPF